MLATPDTTKPIFGIVLNGSEFLCLKLVQDPVPRYAMSDLFALLSRGNDLHPVLQVLKRMSQLIVV